MNDEILNEIHSVKDANGERFATVAALAVELARHERRSAASGRKVITLPLPAMRSLRAHAKTHRRSKAPA